MIASHAFEFSLLPLLLFTLAAVSLFLLRTPVGLADFVIWLILVFKAYQGQIFKLPVIGDMAEKQADTV